MGQNLSSKIVVDTSVDIISPEDAFETRNLGLLWLGSVYGIFMIWATILLVDRWRGPHGKSAVGFGSVLAAMLLSTAWPLVFVYIMMSG